MFIHPPIPLLAQILDGTRGDRVAAENAALVFSGPQFFTALIAGVLLAFAFGLLLTNFGLAAWMSLMGKDSGRKHRESPRHGESHEQTGPVVGVATLVSVTVSLFFASFFAAKLSLLVSPTLGAIVGLVIWATYFVILVWFSSSTVGSLLGSLVNTATAGFQTLVSSVGALLGGRAVNRQVVATAEAAAAAVRREIGSAIDPVSLRESVQDYIEMIRPPQMDWNRIRSDFEAMLTEPGIREAIESGEVPRLDRQTFIDLIGDRSDLSKREVERLADQLESVWQKTVKERQKTSKPDSFIDYLKSATRDQLLGSDFGRKLDDFIARSKQPDGGPGMSGPLALGLNGLIGLILGRTDLSDLDLEKIVGQFHKAKEKLGEGTEKIVDTVSSEPSYNPIKTDIEHYLESAYSWQMQPAILRREFRNLLYDREADPEQVLQELERVTRADFRGILERKGLLTREEIRRTADLLNEVRLEVLSVAREAREQEIAMDMLAEVENYLLTTPKEELTNSEILGLNFRGLIEDTAADLDTILVRFAPLNRPLLERLLAGREDLTPEESAAIVLQLEQILNNLLEQARARQIERQTKIEERWTNLENYLRGTGKDNLNADAMRRELGTILQETRGSEDFDRDRPILLLSQRSDLTDEEAENIVDEVEKNWIRARVTGRQLTGRVQEQYDRIMGSIEDYLRGTGKAELNPEGIKRDLNLLLADPRAGSSAIRQRLGRVDRDTLVKLLSQRQDLNEEQVNQTIDAIQENLRVFARTPRRLARRATEEARNFRDSIAEYLRSTHRSELNPEGIQRDLTLLLNDPRAGVENLQERLSHFDRDTLVALLSQRQDIDEKDVNRIIDEMMVVRERFLERLQGMQRGVQRAIEALFARIRDYLNSLERPELNYEGIRDDIRRLFDDPGAGFTALRDRFSHIDRDTLIALLSSREDISPAQAERIIAGIEGTRDRILRKAERLQEQTQHRLEQVKREAREQMEETREAATKAAWWLFFIALVSAIAAAFGGAIGVIKPI
ncbi:MFS transporter [Pannus brasiliensis CCIBt3594]|uniref:MFS transporter n=1 Tax=Pannus brasiliensis CCIBt3594 TaxID=1427578 RepID=A0AAW9QKQ1_9CHRO